MAHDCIPWKTKVELLSVRKKFNVDFQGLSPPSTWFKSKTAHFYLKPHFERERRLRWFGHVEHSSGAIRTAYDMQIDGKRGAGRPKQTWKKLTEKDCSEWKLTTVDPQERSTWRSGVRSAMYAASQLPGKGPTDVDDAPAPAR